MPRTWQFSFGTVTCGSLRNEDLLGAFSAEIESRFGKDHKSLIGYNAATQAIETLYGVISDETHEQAQDELYESNFACELVQEMADALSEDLPAFVYFGAHEGDGSDLGYWLSHDSLQDAIADGEVITTSDAYEPGELALANGVEYVAYVNDHGNITLYTRDGEILWSVV